MPLPERPLIVSEGPASLHQIFCGLQQNRVTGLTSLFFKISHPYETLGFGLSTAHNNFVQQVDKNDHPSFNVYAFCRRSSKLPYMKRVSKPLIDIAHCPIGQDGVAFKVKGDQG